MPDSDKNIRQINNDNVSQSTEEGSKKKKKKNFKSKLIVIEAIILLILVAVFYFYYSTQEKKRSEVNNSYKNLQILNEELDNCQELITKDQVNPNEYDYCRTILKKFN